MPDNRAPALIEIARQGKMAIYVELPRETYEVACEAARIANVAVEYILAKMARRMGDDFEVPYVIARRGPLRIVPKALRRSER